MTWALRQRDTVLVVEHRLLYKIKGAVPEEPYVLPPCTVSTDAKVADPEITLVGVSQAAAECEVAAKRLAEEGIRAEVLRVLGLSPMDATPIIESARRTHRVVIADTAWTSCGVSAEIAARVAEAGVLAQVKRLGFQPTPCPTAKRLENEFYKETTAGGIAEAAFSMVRATGEFRARLSAETGFKGPF
jgi:pyruvate dehydrogenase E1 component beta subunit